ncbi:MULTISPECIES: hypothetical protein [unclassified Sphingopyxis]|uniref:hypothetical protein n=1 Tax=unclassified Sphingopyxis TaxID=2614943 RepID=UPI0024AE7E41|nr:MULTISPECIES: hypothetical protein [unclassified Sphingopyxis]
MIEPHPYTEHQQDADFGELVRYIGAAPQETPSERADGQASKQIADERRQLEPARHKPADEGEHQSHEEHGEKPGIVEQ